MMEASMSARLQQTAYQATEEPTDQQDPSSQLNTVLLVQ